eukprot:m.1373267 g.1373267  ORF g.1373267 m.1373267 type:complete len:484 (-) comp24955_c1_seq139:3808-5259(-)
MIKTNHFIPRAWAAARRLLALCTAHPWGTNTPQITRREDIAQVTGEVIPETIWNSICAFSWIGSWESWDPKKVEALNITGKYPFLRYAQLFTATGGCRAGFSDPSTKKTCEPWLDADAPLEDGGYNWTRLLHAIDNVRAAGLYPYVVTGNVPISMSSAPTLGGFGVNTQLPKNLTQYRLYLESFAEAAVTRYGAQDVQKWKWGVLTEYNNPSWFDDGGATGYFKLYDFTVAALENVLGTSIGAVGAHACTVCGAPTYSTGWDGLQLLNHVLNGTNYYTGQQGSRLDFWSASFYTAVPEGSSPGSIPPWSIGNFEEVLRPLRDLADANGLHSLPIGIDEGRILAEPGGKLQLTGSRAVGSPYMAAFDALWFKKMLDTGVSWYSRWAVNTNGPAIGNPGAALDSASTQTALLTYRMRHNKRVKALSLCFVHMAYKHHKSLCKQLACISGSHCMCMNTLNHFHHTRGPPDRCSSTALTFQLSWRAL